MINDPPLSADQADAIGKIQAELYRNCERSLGTAAESYATMRHDALAQLRRRERELSQRRGLFSDAETTTLRHLLAHLKRVAQRRHGHPNGEEAAKRHDVLKRVLDGARLDTVELRITKPYERTDMFGRTPEQVKAHDRNVSELAASVLGRMGATAKPAQAPVTPDPNKELRDAGYVVVPSARGGWHVLGYQLDILTDSRTTEPQAWAAARQHFNEAQAKAVQRFSSDMRAALPAIKRVVDEMRGNGHLR